MTDVNLFSDSDTVELIADKMHDKILSQVSGLSGVELRKDKTEKKNKEGILDILKNKYSGYLHNTKKEYDDLKKKKQSGGSVTALTMFVVTIKIILMTIGTYMFNYFPVVFLISLMCFYIEYKLTVTMGHNIVGMPMMYMMCAFCCPCCWTCFRLFKGWTNKLNISTGALWSLLINCSDPISILNIHKVDGSVCKDGDCYIVSKNCHNVLYPRQEKS